VRHHTKPIVGAGISNDTSDARAILWFEPPVQLRRPDRPWRRPADELRAIRFKDFHWQRRQLTIFAKGAKIRTLPLPDATLWTELERLIQDVEAQPSDYLMCLVKPIPVGAPDQRGRRRMAVRRFADRQMSATAMHRWWYRQLEKARIVATGDTSGERMHKARHTAGQRVLDATGDLKLTQRLLGHASIQTTGDIYVDYDNPTFAAKMAGVLRADES